MSENVVNILVLVGVVIVALLALKALTGFLKTLVLIILLGAGIAFLGLRMGWFDEDDVNKAKEKFDKKSKAVMQDVKKSVHDGIDKSKDKIVKEVLESEKEK